MALSKDKTRLVINPTKKLKSELERLASEDNRSLSNYVIKLLEQHIKDIK